MAIVFAGTKVLAQWTLEKGPWKVRDHSPSTSMMGGRVGGE